MLAIFKLEYVPTSGMSTILDAGALSFIGRA